MRKYCLIIFFSCLATYLNTADCQNPPNSQSQRKSSALEKYDDYYFWGDIIVSRAKLISTGKYGIIDKQGNEIVKCVYDYEFNAGGYYQYRLDRNYKQGSLLLMKKDGKYGFVNKEGKEVVPFIYDEVGDYYESYRDEGMLKLSRNGKYGFIDVDGKEIVPCIYDEVSDRPREGCVYVKRNGKYGFFDNTGKEIAPLIYSNAGNFSGGLAAVQQDKKWGYIDKSGELVIPCIYNGAYSNRQDFQHGLAIVVDDNHKYGCIDRKGKVVIPFIYDPFVWVNKHGFTIVRKGDKWGVASNTTGEELVPCIHNVILDKIDGVIVIGVGGKKDSDGCISGAKFGCLDKNGKEIIPCIYTDIVKYSDLAKNPNKFLDTNYIIVGKGGEPCGRRGGGGLATYTVYCAEKYGLFDKKGNEIMPCIYSRDDFFDKLKTLKK